MPMAIVRLIAEEEATGKVREVFDDIKATKQIDFVPNIWRALANNPEHLEAAWHKLKAIMRPGKLDMLTKEMIALAVSITNSCVY
jgi:alkylhydroperoxidase family enzyme